MYGQIEQKEHRENKSRAVATVVTQRKNKKQESINFLDNRNIHNIYDKRIDKPLQQRKMNDVVPLKTFKDRNVCQQKAKIVSNLTSPVLQKAAYQQPSSKVDPVLGTKCFAYAAFNALHDAGIPKIVAMNQDAVDTWIRVNMQFNMGGGPGDVYKKLIKSGLIPKRTDLQQKSNLGTGGVHIKTALTLKNPVPVSLGVSWVDTKKKGNHWVRAHIVGNVVVGDDQQNPAFGNLNFNWAVDPVSATVGKRTYTITTISYLLAGDDPDHMKLYETLRAL